MFTEKEAAKSRLWGAVTGLILAISSVLILRTINPQLTNINLEQNLSDNAGEIVAESISIPDELQISGGDAYLRETGQYTGSGPNVTKNITTYDSILKQASSEFGISCTVLKAHAYAESNMNPKAKSKAGAQGLIQLMPKTFASTKVGTDPYDPLTNARAAAYYLKQLSTQACGKKSHPSCTENPYSQYVTAAYNGGPGINFPGTCGKTKWECKEKYKGGVNNETIGYVNHVWANIEVLNKNGWGC